MLITINLDDVFKAAMENMSEENDINWPIGQALQELYFDQGIEQLQEKMIKQFKLNEGN
jgi:hypothetical protein